MSTEREIAYRLDPALWVREATGGHANALAGDSSCGRNAALLFWR